MTNKRLLRQKYNLIKAITPDSGHENEHDENSFCAPGRLKGGVYTDSDKNVHFKFFTFKDVEKVCVEIKPFDKRIFKILPMEKTADGVFELTVNGKVAKHRDRYRFIIYREGKPVKRVRDPYSMLQDDFPVWSIIYNHNKYKWKDRAWQLCEKKERVSAIADEENKLTPVGALRIFELNIPSLTEKGSYKAASKKLKEAKDIGFNAIEIMPVENCYGYNWGYDGVDKFAPNNTYGTPDDLKALIDYAHKLKLNVIMDMVPNHIGFDMCDIDNAGPYTDGCNEFGKKFNFEKKDNLIVRNFIAGAALNWLINYHCDGLRLDLTKYMNSDFTMKQLAAEIKNHVPNAFLIAEDARENDVRVTKPFTEEEIFENTNNHERFISKIAKNSISLENLGYNSEWDFQYHKQIAAQVLEYWGGYPANIDALDYVVKNSGMRVKYPMSHDEIGNVDGTRLITKIFAKEINIYKNVPLDYKNRREQKFAHAAQNILKTLMTGELENFTNTELNRFKKNNFLSESATITSLKGAYKAALAKMRLATAFTFFLPGPKMIFQGDEKGDIGYFKFFRELSCGYEKALEEKGYKPGLSAFLDSKPGTIHYSPKYHKDLGNTKRMMKVLNTLNEQNPALQTGRVVGTVTHPISRVIAVHIKLDDNEIFSTANFSSDFYFDNYKIEFPEGEWVEIFNTNERKFGNDGSFTNPEKKSGGIRKISLPAYSLCVFKKV